MAADELLLFLIENIPNFHNPTLIQEQGICYHYTQRWSEINEEGFKGAPINLDLDRTQLVGSPIVEKGVVFAYENIEHAKDEGLGMQIVKIKYNRCLRALHLGEDSLGGSFANAAIGTDLEGLLDSSGAPDTLLILVEDIIDYELTQ